MKQPHLRIGTTSYILADDILPNVRYLAPLVDDIELVLFESEGMSNLPSKQVIEELAALAENTISPTRCISPWISNPAVQIPSCALAACPQFFPSSG
jgi:hypothetical protein